MLGCEEQERGAAEGRRRCVAGKGGEQGGKTCVRPQDLERGEEKDTSTA